MDTSVLSQINALRQATVAQLRLEWQRLHGEPTRSRNRDYLWKRLAWRLQELQHGGLSDRARRRIEQLAPEGPVWWSREDHSLYDLHLRLPKAPPYFVGFSIAADGSRGR